MLYREPTVYSKEANQKFWSLLNDDQRGQITKEAKRIMSVLDLHMEGLSENDPDFLNHFSFDILMDILRRPTRPPYQPKGN
jgi:hypothetical protein